MANERFDCSEFIEQTERLFSAILRYSEACREFWYSLDKPQQRSFFPPIFDAAFSLEERLWEHSTPLSDLMRVDNGSDLLCRGIEIVRAQVFNLTFSYRCGIECSVANTLPPSFSEDAEVARPDLRCFLSPLRMALALMGSKLGNTPKESWWLEECEVVVGNPVHAILDQIERRLKTAESTHHEDDTRNKYPRAGDSIPDDRLLTIADVAEMIVNGDTKTLTNYDAKTWGDPDRKINGARAWQWGKFKTILLTKRRLKER